MHYHGNQELTRYPISHSLRIKNTLIYFLIGILVSCSSKEITERGNSSLKSEETDAHIETIQDGTIVLLYKVQKEIAIASLEGDTTLIHQLLIDRIFEPNHNLFTYCLGYDRETFIGKYTNSYLTQSDDILERIKLFEAKHLDDLLIETMRKIVSQSVYKFEGRYTIGFFEDVGCIMCGCDNYTMLGNTYNDAYKDLESLKVVIAHEMNHNFFESSKQDDPLKNTVLYNSIDEGFANFFSMKILNIDTLKAFNMSKEEYQWLLDHEYPLKEKFRDVMYSTNEEDWDPYSEKIQDRILVGSPGDVGYFIGFRIIEMWLKQDKNRNWQDIYTTPVQKILEESRYMKTVNAED